MARRGPIRIGITLGDINGIGPEIALKAAQGWAHGAAAGVRLVLIGPAEVLREQGERFGLETPPVESCAQTQGTSRVIAWDVGGEPGLRWRPGSISSCAARASVAALRVAVAAARAGRLDAIVTCPIHKAAWGRAGISAPGHTELLAEWCGVRRFAMMLIGGPLRVLLVTRHIPLRQVARAVTRPAVREAIELGRAGLEWLGLRAARIAVCGLNPHAGDGGRLGTEELRVVAPEVRRARRLGWEVSGPVPADTVFHQALAGRYDLVIAQYHDQGLAPLKMMAFESGVNLTLGLPIIRTSPDHGTAFDIAGRGVATPHSLLEAIRLAAKLAARPNPWRAR